MYTIKNTKKVQALLKQKKRTYRTSDLSVLWNISNSNTLRVTINRYVKRGILYGVYRGLYSTVPVEKLDKYELGCAIAGPLSYVSTETVLKDQGIILQRVLAVTLVGRRSKDVTINDTRYLCRAMKKEVLVNRKGILSRDNYQIAGKERAMADMLHYDPRYYFDNEKGVNKAKLNNFISSIKYK